MMKDECRTLNESNPVPVMRVSSLAIIFFVTFSISVVVAEVPATQPLPNFVRFVEDGNGGGKMQAAVGRYMNSDGVRVDLLSTMHIGDAAFFRDLSKRLPPYDAVLYELVAHRGQRADEEGVNPQQQMIARDAGLENQGDHMSYRRKNFVHADLDLEDIQKLEIEKHGTFKGALGDGPGIMLARGEQDAAGDLLIENDFKAAKLATPSERIRLMRRGYSRQLVTTCLPPAGQTYPPGMEVLVGARNDQIIKIMTAQMDGGKKKLAVFYGAAHMVDMESRLFKMGFERQSVVWQTSWTVEPDGTPTTQPTRKSIKSTLDAK